jgi:non-heme Fe2+,alpha-ketoglutarate-dependent halogenase
VYDELVALEQVHLDNYRTKGYAGPFTLFTPDEAARLARRIQEEVFPVPCDIYAHTQPDSKLKAYRKSFDASRMRDRHLDSPLMYRMATSEAIVSRLRSLLGPDILLWRSDTFLQEVGDEPTPAHQDRAFEATRATHPMIEAGEGQVPAARQTYPVEVDIPLSINAWMSFSSTPGGSGAMWFVPGSHKELVLEVPGQGFAGKPYVLSRDFGPSDGEIVEVQAGQFLLFDNIVVHGSMPVLGDPRLAWTPRYVSTQAQIHRRSDVNAQGQDLSRYGALLVSGQDRLKRNVLRAPPPVGAVSLLDERAVAKVVHD